MYYIHLPRAYGIITLPSVENVYSAGPFIFFRYVFVPIMGQA